MTSHVHDSSFEDLCWCRRWTHVKFDDRLIELLIGVLMIALTQVPPDFHTLIHWMPNLLFISCYTSNCSLYHTDSTKTSRLAPRAIVIKENRNATNQMSNIPSWRNPRRLLDLPPPHAALPAPATTPTTTTKATVTKPRRCERAPPTQSWMAKDDKKIVRDLSLNPPAFQKISTMERGNRVKGGRFGWITSTKMPFWFALCRSLSRLSVSSSIAE